MTFQSNIIKIVGEECPIILWWPIEEWTKSYLLIDNFDKAGTNSNCIARTLNLSRRNFVSKESKCLTNFNWRGMLTVCS